MARIPFVRHPTVRQIRTAFRRCRHAVEKARWQVVWLLARTDVLRTPAQVAEGVGLSAVAVRQLLHRWNAHGPAGFANQRASNGAASKLTPRRRNALRAALRRRPPDGGLWTGPKVVRYVATRWGVSIGPVTAWRWLRQFGLTLRVPRPRHPNAADPPTRRRWK